MDDTYSIRVKCEIRPGGLRSYRAMAVRHQHKAGPVVLYLSEPVEMPSRWNDRLVDSVLGHLIAAARRYALRFAARDEGADQIVWVQRSHLGTAPEAPVIAGRYGRDSRVVAVGRPEADLGLAEVA